MFIKFVKIIGWIIFFTIVFILSVRKNIRSICNSVRIFEIDKIIFWEMLFFRNILTIISRQLFSESYVQLLSRDNFQSDFDFSLSTIYSRIIFWKFPSGMQIALIMGGWSWKAWKCSVTCDTIFFFSLNKILYFQDIFIMM